MKLSKFQIARRDQEKQKAILLYKQGLSLRAVEAALKQMGIRMSHSSVARAVNTLSTTEA